MGTDEELRGLSLAARDVIPLVDRKAKDNAKARARTAEVIGKSRSELAGLAQICQPVVPTEVCSTLVTVLIDVSKVESVVETAADLVSASKE